MQYYYIKKNFRDTYGNYDRYMVFFIWRYLKAVSENTAIAIEMTYRTNLEVFTYDT